MAVLSYCSPAFGGGTIHNQIGITEDADDFLIKQIPELELEATDSLYDLEDNEGECIVKINDVLKPLISSKSQMQ